MKYGRITGAYQIRAKKRACCNRLKSHTANHNDVLKSFLFKLGM